MVSKPLIVRGLATTDPEELPPLWVPQDSNCVAIDVPVDSPEWRTVALRFHASLKDSVYHIIRIERVQARATTVKNAVEITSLLLPPPPSLPPLAPPPPAACLRPFIAFVSLAMCASVPLPRVWVQNLVLWRRYQTEKRVMAAVNGADNVNERTYVCMPALNAPLSPTHA